MTDDLDVRRWKVPGNDDTFGFGCQAQWTDAEGLVVATTGNEPPPGTTFLTDEEFVDAVVEQDALTKQRHDSAEQARVAASLLAIAEAEADQAALVAAGIPIEVAERMVVKPSQYQAVPYARLPGWDQWLVETYYLTEQMIEEIRERVEE